MALIRLFLEICLFTKGPQNVPGSRLLLCLALFAYALVGMLILLMNFDLLTSGLQVLVEAGLLAVFTLLALYLSGKTERWLKTMIALYGTDALVSILAIPVLLWLELNPDVLPVFLLLGALMLWHLVVVGHIFRHALAMPYPAGFVVAFAYTALSYRVVLYLFPHST